MASSRLRYVLVAGLTGFLAANALRRSFAAKDPPGMAGDVDRPPVADTTDIHRLVNRIEGSFREVYLILISIIQGVALGYLALGVADKYESLGVDGWGRTTGTMLIILVMWQEYMVGATAFSWVPTILDSVVPFLLGLSEFFTIAAIPHPLSHYLFFMTAFYGLGMIACLNYYFQTRRPGSAVSESSRSVIDIHPRVQYRICAGCFMFLLGLWLLALTPDWNAYRGLLSWTSTLPSLVFAMSVIPRWNRPIHAMLRGLEADAGR